jgi:hypothetical protein
MLFLCDCIIKKKLLNLPGTYYLNGWNESSLAPQLEWLDNTFKYALIINWHNYYRPLGLRLFNVVMIIYCIL